MFAVLAGFLAVGLNLNPREVPSPLVGKSAPAFALPRLEAPEVRVLAAFLVMRLQGITVGSRDGFEAMMRAIDQHKLVPVIDRVFAFEELKEAMEQLKRGAHFGKLCIRH